MVRVDAHARRKDAILQSMKSGEYAQAMARLGELNQKYDAAELGKTFGGSDLDEAYYYRNLAEYERDHAMTEVRHAYAEAGIEAAVVDKIYGDPPSEVSAPEASPKMRHILSEIARMDAHASQIQAAMAEAPPKAQKALRHSREAELVVAEKLKAEVKNQQRVDDALAAMTRIDGPNEPPLWEMAPWKSPLARGEAASMLTAMPPADSPKIVTLPGSPPKAAMLFFTQWRPAMRSRRP